MFFRRMLRPLGFIPAEPSSPPMKMSEALRKGMETMPERHLSYSGCAIGTAWRAQTGKEQGLRRSHDPVGEVAQVFGMPRRVVYQAEDLFESRRMTRAEVADWLAGQGY